MAIKSKASFKLKTHADVSRGPEVLTLVRVFTYIYS